MLTILIGADWVANRNAVMERLTLDVHGKLDGRILMVPELISHETERRLSMAAGDTCSRYAEVLTFSRLTRRVCDWCGCGIEECLDNGGRLVSMASAARQLHSKLKAYAALETKPEFLSGLIDAVDEFKRCRISAADLSRAAAEAEGGFAQKLEELSLLLEAYDAVCQRGKKDPRDQMNWLLEQLEDCTFAENHVFYVDGFPDYTRQHMAVLKHLIHRSSNVTVTINADKADSQNPAFGKSVQTLKQLLKIAKEVSAAVEILTVPAGDNPLHLPATRLFCGNTDGIPIDDERLRVASAASIQQECLLASEQILELMHAGARYRDISIVCADMASYLKPLISILRRCGIPVYAAGTENILEKSVLSAVLGAIDAALSGFSQKDVLRYIKSILSPLPLRDCDEMENYVLLWNIQGNLWLREWTLHPRGFEDIWNEDDKERLDRLNRNKALVLTPLKNLSDGFRDASSLSDKVSAIYRFVDEIDLCSRLETLSRQMEAGGDLRNAQIMAQLWDILLTALEQLDSVLGDTYWDSDTFVRLLKLLLSQYNVGTIPTVLDTVTIGGVSAMRCQQTPYLLVLGANEGVFPKYASTSGILSDRERKQLRNLGVPLTGGADEGLEIEFSEIFGVFCGAKERIYISCLADKSSYPWKRLLRMTQKLYIRQCALGSTAANPNEAAAYLLKNEDVFSAQELGLSELYTVLQKKKNYELGTISAQGILRLYGQKLRLSASQIDKQADCRFAYFLKYGLRAQPRKPAQIDPAEFGTYVHAVLENTARDVCASGGFRTVGLEQTLEIAEKHSDAYIAERFSQIDSQRVAYLFNRNIGELMLVVEELWNELQDSSFVPVAFEAAFGDGSDLSAIPVPGKLMDAQLQGFVDRVDAWCDSVHNYFRVVDYKTGQKSFDYCDVFNGLGLQMLLYLFALEQEGEKLIGSCPKPAGVQYFPARVPIITSDSALSDEQAQYERLSTMKRKGLLLNDNAVLRAMEHTDPPVRLNCKKKDDIYTGDVADREQLQQLKKYVFRLLGNMVDEIASGTVAPNPYTRGNSHNACRFCDYSQICHAATVDGRRNYKTMTSQRFWEEIGKELEKHV